MKNVKLLVVNLRRHSERREKISKSLLRLGADYEIFPATDGHLLDESWVIENLTENFRERYKEKKGSYITMGSLACADSFRRAYKHFLTSCDHDYLLILQDDVELPDDFSDSVEECCKKMMSSELEMLLLFFWAREGTVLRKIPQGELKRGCVYSFPSPPPSGAQATLFTRNAVEKMYEYQKEKISNMTDSWDLEASSLSGKAGVVFPTVVVTGHFSSTMRDEPFQKKIKILCGRLLMSSFLRNSYIEWRRRRDGKRIKIV